MTSDFRVFAKEDWKNFIDTTLVTSARSIGLRYTEAALLIDTDEPQFPCFIYHGPWIDLTRRNYTIIHADPSQNLQQASGPQSEKEKNQKKAETAKWVALCVGAVAAVMTGYFWTAFRKTAEMKSSTSNIQNLLDSSAWVESGRSGEVLTSLYKLVGTKLKIDKANYNKARDYLTSSVILLTGAMSAGIGSILVMPVVITAGYIAIAFGGMFLFLTIGTYWSLDEGNRRLHYEITGYTYKNNQGEVRRVEGLADKATKAIMSVDESMQSPPQYQPVNPENFEPLYPELPLYPDNLPPPYNPDSMQSPK